MFNQKNRNILTIFFFSLFYAWGSNQINPAMAYSLRDFQTITPEKNGFSRKTLEDSVSKIGKMAGIYGVIVVHNGYLTVEQYFREGAHNRPHNLKSASKSVISALIGIAIDKGYLRLNQPISDFFPFIKTLDDQRKNEITVKHLLSMTSGLQSMSYQAYNSWVLNGNWLNKLLKLPIVAEPGTKHQYSTGDTHILSAVLTAATGMSTKEFAVKYLFGPMHVPIKGWQVDPQGIYQGGNNLSIFPTDIAKFGQLYLNGGQFEGKQIIPNWWVSASTRMIQPAIHPLYGGYGYLWYTQPRGEDAFVAVGYGGQYIYISPEDQTVIVIISTLKSKGKRWEFLLFDHIQHGILASITDKGQPNAPLTKGIATTTLNIRKSPSIKSPIITTVDPGHILMITGKKGTWLQVDAPPNKGWVVCRFVNLVNPENFAIIDTMSKHLHRSSPTPLKDKAADIKIVLNQHANLLEKLKISQKETSKINSDIFSLRKGVRKLQDSFHNKLQLQQKTNTEYKRVQAKNILDLQKNMDRERLGRDQLETELDAFKIVLTSLRSENRHSRRDFLLYENKTNNIDLKVLRLADKLEKKQQVFEEIKDIRQTFAEKFAKLRKELSSLAPKDINYPAAPSIKKDLGEVAAKINKPIPIYDANDKLERISPFLASWSKAWSQKNIAVYLSHYSDDFIPPKGMNLQKWRAKRKKNITKPKFIKITISKLQKKMITPTKAKIIFNQSYKSNTFADHVIKSILLQWQQDTWKIISEKSK